VNTPSEPWFSRIDLFRQPVALLWWPVNAVQAAFTVIWSVACICLALLIHTLTRSQRLPLTMARHCWAPGLMLGAGARLKVDGADRVDWSRPVVLVANHQSMIDICALFRAAPKPLRFVLKDELTRLPFLGWYTRAMGMIGIARGNGRKAQASLERAVGLVRSGACLAAFPEGTRGRPGRLGAFKGGAFQIAIAAGCTVVPVAIIGSGDVLPAGGFRVRPGVITLRFGEPIPTTGLSSTDRQTLARQAHDAVAALLARAPD
jgi:1-acyl-sn-glycerol-3-phosphate acyltransferase